MAEKSYFDESKFLVCENLPETMSASFGPTVCIFPIALFAVLFNSNTTKNKIQVNFPFKSYQISNGL